MTYKKCKNCQKEFKIKSNHQLFCSPNCFKISRKKYQQSPERKKQQKEHAQKPEVRKRRREIANLPKNKKKRVKYFIAYRQRPYVKKKKREEDKSPKGKAWRKNWNEKKIKKAKKLLGGKCFACGTNRQLEFHHIKYAISSKTSMNHNEALKHPERFILLCRKCHNIVTFVLREPKRAVVVLTNLHKIS